jgi:aspartate/methionine/tyrosine aminotransferase
MRISARAAEMQESPFDDLKQRAARMRAAGANVITLGQALPSFGPPRSAVAAAVEALQTAEDVHVYSADAGRASLRQQLAARLRESHGIDCTADDLIITAGGNQAFMLAMLTLVGAGDEVLLPAPYFINHQMAVAAAGALPVEVPLREERGFATTWDALEPFVTTRTRAVVLCNPSNPTGAVIDGDEGERIAAELADRDIAIVSDETYMHFVYGRPHWSAASTRDWRRHVAVVNTFSKSFGMTGWRLGYMLADQRVCLQAIKIQDAMVICAPVVSQIAGERAIADDWSYPQTYHGELLERRKVLMDGISRISRLEWVPTGGAFFAFVRVKECTNSVRLAADILERARIVVSPGSAFGAAGEGCLRISYGSVGSEELRNAMERLAAFFETWNPCVHD